MAKDIPVHIAFIPDGNRRWAKMKNKPSSYGHDRGVAIFHDVMRHAVERGVKVVSIWGMSQDNFIKRSPREIADLLRIFQAEFERMLTDSDIHEQKIRVRVLGDWRKRFPRKLRNAIVAVEEATESYSNHALNLFLAYNGTDEMIEAVKNIVKAGRKKVTAKTIKENLITKDLPSVDFLVRTGGEPHLSAGFMMWDIANAELYFTNTLWPAFTDREFDKALESYAARRRKRGA